MGVSQTLCCNWGNALVSRSVYTLFQAFLLTSFLLILLILFVYVGIVSDLQLGELLLQNTDINDWVLKKMYFNLLFTNKESVEYLIFQTLSLLSRLYSILQQDH